MAEGVQYDVAAGNIWEAGNQALEEIMPLWSVDDQITEIREMVSTIQALLLEAEAEQHNRGEASEGTKLWLKRLKDAMCDAFHAFRNHNMILAHVCS